MAFLKDWAKPPALTNPEYEALLKDVEDYIAKNYTNKEGTFVFYDPFSGVNLENLYLRDETLLSSTLWVIRNEPDQKNC